jgi:hypothetical protein
MRRISDEARERVPADALVLVAQHLDTDASSVGEHLGAQPFAGDLSKKDVEDLTGDFLHRPHLRMMPA